MTKNSDVLKVETERNKQGKDPEIIVILEPTNCKGQNSFIQTERLY